MGREEHFIFNIPDILGTGQKFDDKVNIIAFIYQFFHLEYFWPRLQADDGSLTTGPLTNLPLTGPSRHRNRLLHLNHLFWKDFSSRDLLLLHPDRSHLLHTHLQVQEELQDSRKQPAAADRNEVKAICTWRRDFSCESNSRTGRLWSLTENRFIESVSHTFQYQMQIFSMDKHLNQGKPIFLNYRTFCLVNVHIAEGKGTSWLLCTTWQYGQWRPLVRLW